jgi:hypothetical protein
MAGRPLRAQAPLEILLGNDLYVFSYLLGCLKHQLGTISAPMRAVIAGIIAK